MSTETNDTSGDRAEATERAARRSRRTSPPSARRSPTPCKRADRDPSEVTLIAVTKTYPASDVRLLAELGVLDVGENRDQEASPKAAATAGLGLRWHFIGQLQTNKAASVAAYASHVHSVDRVRLVAACRRHASRRWRKAPVRSIRRVFRMTMN